MCFDFGSCLCLENAKSSTALRRLVIVNLQKTLYDKKAAVRVFAPVDSVMRAVFSGLPYGIPGYQRIDTMRIVVALEKLSASSGTLGKEAPPHCHVELPLSLYEPVKRLAYFFFKKKPLGYASSAVHISIENQAGNKCPAPPAISSVEMVGSYAVSGGVQDTIDDKAAVQILKKAKIQAESFISISEPCGEDHRTEPPHQPLPKTVAMPPELTGMIPPGQNERKEFSNQMPDFT